MQESLSFSSDAAPVELRSPFVFFRRSEGFLLNVLTVLAFNLQLIDYCGYALFHKRSRSSIPTDFLEEKADVNFGEGLAAM
jgi:hypothetical protein